jgi:hypothetical protein
MKTKGSSGECDRRDSSFIKIICSDVTTLVGPKLVEFSSSCNDLELYWSSDHFPGWHH